MFSLSYSCLWKKEKKKRRLNGIIRDDHQFSYFTKMKKPKKQKTLVPLVI